LELDVHHVAPRAVQGQRALEADVLDGEGQGDLGALRAAHEEPQRDGQEEREELELPVLDERAQHPQPRLQRRRSARSPTTSPARTSDTPSSSFRRWRRASGSATGSMRPDTAIERPPVSSETARATAPLAPAMPGAPPAPVPSPPPT